MGPRLRRPPQAAAAVVPARGGSLQGSVAASLLKLGTDYSQEDAGALDTRIQAFLGTVVSRQEAV